LFDELEKVGIRRNDCIVANTVACRPPNNKLPNITYVTKCPWATEAIKRFRPKFILASGNSALYYFRKINKGITEWSGKTEWNNRAEAWVTYCLHPASALYDRAANLPVLQKALTEFATVVRNFL
jgi:uracil-DNA glycosylase family 4